jgi:hypothetical protein
MAAVVIAGTFVALMITSRGPTDAELAQHDRLEKFGEEQVKLAIGDDCHDAVGHAVSIAGDYLTSRYGDGAPDGIRELAIHRCTQDRWPADVIRCLDKVSADTEMQRCIGQLPDYQRRAVEAEMRAFSQRPPQIRDAGADAEIDAFEYRDLDDPYAPLAPVPPVDGTPPGCKEYEDTIEKIMTCDKLPQASRDAMRQGFDAMKQGWRDLANLPPESREAMESACRQGTEALKQVGNSMCGW